MKTTGYFRKAISILKKHPKLFVPKIVIAGLFGIGMIFTAKIAFQIPLLDSIPVEEKKYFLFASGMLLFYTIIVAILDTIVNGAFPVMIEQLEKKEKISFRTAFRKSLDRSRILITTELAVLAGFSIATLPIIFLLLFLIAQNKIFFAVFLSIMLVLIVFSLMLSFYWLYPVAVMEKKGAVESFKKMILLSWKNFEKIAFASIIPFSVSLTNIILAFFSDNTMFLAAFVLMRFITAIVYTYHLVLNPEIYFSIEK